MKHVVLKNLLVVATLSLLLSGCFRNTPETKSTKAPGLYVVNVLSKELYDDAHIKGSIHVDLDALETEAQAWDKKTPVVLYCSNYMCTASSHAARELKKMGFEKVYAFEGGTAQWFQLSKNDPSYIIEGPATESYLSHEVAAPEHEEHDVDIISAQDLKNKMHSAGLL